MEPAVAVGVPVDVDEKGGTSEPGDRPSEAELGALARLTGMSLAELQASEGLNFSSAGLREETFASLGWALRSGAPNLRSLVLSTNRGLCDTVAASLASSLPFGCPRLCLLYTSPSPRDQRGSRMPSSA